MENFNLDELMDLAEAYVGPMIDAIYRRLMDRDFGLEDPEIIMLLTALINILGHDNRGDRPTEVLLMAEYGERGVLDRPNMRAMRWRNGALSGSDLANEPGLGSSRTYQSGEMPMPSTPKPGLTRMHQEMNSEAASSGSPLRAAVPSKRAKVEQKVQTNQTIQDLDGIKDEVERTKRELDEVTKTMLIAEDDRDMWERLLEDCNKKQGEENERLRQEYKERSERRALSTSVEKVIPARSIPLGQSPMELLTPREMSQITETRLPTATDRVTFPDPSDTLDDPVVEQTVRKLIETAGRLVANKNAPGSGVTAPYGTIDDTGRVRLSQTEIRQGVSDATPPMASSKAPESIIRKMPAKKVSRVKDVQKNNQSRYNFTGVLETDPRAFFNRATWNPAVNMQQPPLGTSHLILIHRQQSSSEPGQRTDVHDGLGEAPVRRTIQPRRRLGPVNRMEEATGTSRSDTRSETTSTSREERRPDRGSLMWSRPIPSPWHVYKDELMKLDLQGVSFIEEARRMLNGARLSVSRLYSITGVDWLIAAGINFSSTTALRSALGMVTAMSNDLWFRAMEVTGEKARRKNSQETRAHLEAMVLRTKPEAIQWLHLGPRGEALGADAFEQGPITIKKIHAYLLKEVNLAENAEEKTAEFLNRMCQITLETFWTHEVKGKKALNGQIA